MELKWTDDDIKEIREALMEYARVNDELNAKIIAMDAYVKNGDAKIRSAQRYILQLEQIIESFTIQNHN